MKTAKKILSLLLIAVTALTVTGCSSFETKMVRAVKKMQELESLHMDMSSSYNIGINLLGDSGNIDFAMDISSDMFTKSDLARIETKVSAVGTYVTWLSYVEKSDSDYTVYLTLDDGQSWQKQSFSLDQLPIQLNTANSMQQIELFIDSAQTFQEVGSEPVNGSDATRFDGILEGAAIKEAIELSGLLDVLSQQFEIDIDLSGFEDGSIPVSIWIDNNSGYIVRYDMDMSDIMSQVLKSVLRSMMQEAGLEDVEDLVSGVEMNGFVASVVYSRFDEIEPFQIPESAKAA